MSDNNKNGTSSLGQGTSDVATTTWYKKMYNQIIDQFESDATQRKRVASNVSTYHMYVREDSTFRNKMSCLQMLFNAIVEVDAGDVMNHASNSVWSSFIGSMTMGTINHGIYDSVKVEVAKATGNFELSYEMRCSNLINVMINDSLLRTKVMDELRVHLAALKAKELELSKNSTEKENTNPVDSGDYDALVGKAGMVDDYDAASLAKIDSALTAAFVTDSRKSSNPDKKVKFSKAETSVSTPNASKMKPTSNSDVEDRLFEALFQ